MIFFMEHRTTHDALRRQSASATLGRPVRCEDADDLQAAVIAVRRWLRVRRLRHDTSLPTLAVGRGAR